MNSKEFLQCYRKMCILKNQEVSLEEAREDIRIMAELIGEAIIADNELKLKNKGKFILADRKERILTNIHTGEKIELPSKKVVKYIHPKNLSIFRRK